MKSKHKIDGNGQPSDHRLKTSNELEERAEKAWRALKQCRLCPHKCGVDRTQGRVGVCKSSHEIEISSFNSHHGEEPPISGQKGSGTIFFTHCTMKCIYCQNYPISQLGQGNLVSIEDLAGMMVKLQKRGCHNINFVTPTHFVPQIIKALVIAVEDGLRIPLVYNTSGYESTETLSLLDGIIDIYLTDMRYANSEMAKQYSAVFDYPRINRQAVLEMQQQVGDLVVDQRGNAIRGLIIRHLVLPGDISGTSEILRFIAKDVSKNVYVSLMAQYFPAYKASGYPPLDRQISDEEYEAAIDVLAREGLDNGWTQQYAKGLF